MENDGSGAPSSMLDVVVGLGANLGEPEAALRRALLGLADLGSITAVSGLYRSQPVGGPPQPEFMNAAARLSFAGAASGLLSLMLALERREGRERRERWGPRTL